MTRDKQTTFEVQIRDTQAHTSDTVAGDADVSIVEDDHHNQESDNNATDSRFRLYDEFAVYVEDDHNEAFDVTIESTAHDDTDYSGAVDENTVTLASGEAAGNARIQGLVGRLRFSTTAPSAAPTSGSLRITVQALGRGRR